MRRTRQDPFCIFFPNTFQIFVNIFHIIEFFQKFSLQTHIFNLTFKTPSPDVPPNGPLFIEHRLLCRKSFLSPLSLSFPIFNSFFSPANSVAPPLRYSLISTLTNKRNGKIFNEASAMIQPLGISYLRRVIRVP